MDKASLRTLVADDERAMRRSVALTVRKLGMEVIEAENETEALSSVAEEPALDMAIVDMRMPIQKGAELDPNSGLRVIEAIRRCHPNAAVVVMTAFGSLENAVEAMQRGAHDYITKPFSSAEELRVRVKRALENRRLAIENARLAEENIQLKAEMSDKYGFSNIVGKSAVMREVFEKIRRAAWTHYNVLIRGETGTGKELVARAIHYNSDRKDRSFIIVNCTSLSRELIESELFGHRKGAFTGAVESRKGVFEEADGGTVFLDEIGDMPLETQPKLLRVLETKEIRPVGESRSKTVDVRVLVATNQDLEYAISEGRFRQDLYARLNVISIDIPPLRERKEDIPLLVHHFLEEISRETSRKQPEISPEAMELLVEHDWMLNVRELENILTETMIFLDRDEIGPDDIRLLRIPSGRSTLESFLPGGILFKDAQKEFERVFLETKLKEHGWDVRRTAETIGIQRTYLYKKIKDYGLNRPF